MRTWEELDKARADLVDREAGKAGLRGRINAKCIECIYDPSPGSGGNWKQQITACTASGCPLWDVRPISKPKRVKK